MPHDRKPTRREQLAERICENSRRLIAKLEQIIIDVEAWNALHPEHSRSTASGPAWRSTSSGGRKPPGMPATRSRPGV